MSDGYRKGDRWDDPGTGSSYDFDGERWVLADMFVFDEVERAIEVIARHMRETAPPMADWVPIDEAHDEARWQRVLARWEAKHR